MTLDKLDASWPTFIRSRCVGERVGDVQARERGQGTDRIFHRGKTRTKRKGRRYTPPWRFWGVEVERPVKNVIKMCLELPRGKDVMNIKRALEAPDVAIDICASSQATAYVLPRDWFSVETSGFIQARWTIPLTMMAPSLQSFLNLPVNLIIIVFIFVKFLAILINY